MALKNYISINNYSGHGTLAISRKAIGYIVEKSILSLGGVSFAEKKNKRSRYARFSLSSPIKISFTNEGKILIKLNVSLPAPNGGTVNEVCLNMQKEISNNLLYMCDTVPYEIRVHVDSIV